MKQIVYEQFGPPAVVTKCVEVADPGSPSAWEILVRIDAFPINPADLAMIHGQYGILNKPPATIGMEAVGTVLEAGKSVTKLQPGDKVIVLANNNWATLRKFPATLAVKVPEHLDTLQLAMLKVSALTALQLITQFEAIKPEQYIIQNAPLSAVGRYVIQIANHLGIKTINLVRRQEQADHVMQLGGDVAILESEDIVPNVREKIGSSVVRLGLDAVAGESTNRLAACLNDGGLLLNYGMLSLQSCQVDARHTIFRGIRLAGFWLSKVLNRMSAQEREGQILQLVELLSAGKIHGPVDSVYPIEQITEAIRRAEASPRKGKVLVSNDAALFQNSSSVPT